MRLFRKHKHIWIAQIPFIIKKGDKEFVRVMCKCKNCGKVGHKHLPSINKEGIVNED